jgi:hypothetical protein
MLYTDLKQTEVIDMNRKYIDIDANGRSDFFFEVLPVADSTGDSTRLLFLCIIDVNPNVSKGNLCIYKIMQLYFTNLE